MREGREAACQLLEEHISKNSPYRIHPYWRPFSFRFSRRVAGLAKFTDRPTIIIRGGETLLSAKVHPGSRDIFFLFDYSCILGKEEEEEEEEGCAKDGSDLFPRATSARLRSSRIQKWRDSLDSLSFYGVHFPLFLPSFLLLTLYRIDFSNSTTHNGVVQMRNGCAPIKTRGESAFEEMVSFCFRSKR